VTALLAVALAVAVLRAIRPSRARLLTGALSLLAVAVAVAHGDGRALTAAAVITVAGTCAVVALLHRRVLLTAPAWAARAGGAA
jgi:hypothetical protein